MKKLIAAILALALLAVSLSVFAETNTQQGDLPQEQAQGESNETTSSGRQNRKGQSGVTDTVSSATQAPANQPEEELSDDSQAPENGEQDNDAQNIKQHQHGQTRSKGQKAQDSREAQPEQKSVQEQKTRKGGSSRKNGFDVFVKQGVISQETADQIKAYLKERQLTEMPEDETSEANDSALHQHKGKIKVTPELLQELLDAEIINQTEYDAMLAMQADLPV